jgi:hypothetical protein
LKPIQLFLADLDFGRVEVFSKIIHEFQHGSRNPIDDDDIDRRLLRRQLPFSFGTSERVA